MEQIMKMATSLWKWEIPDNYPNKWIGIYIREESPDRFGFQHGKRVDNITSVPKFSFNTVSSRLQKYGVLPNNAGSPLVSLEVGELLSDICKESIQLIDTELQTKNDLLTGYKLLNITKLVSSINLEKSSYSLITGSNNIRSFQKRIHTLNGISSNLLAREKLCKSHIIIANDVFESFSSYKIKGVQFSLCAIE